MANKIGLDLGDLIIHLRADIRQYEKEMKSAQAILQKTARKMAAIGTKMSLAVTVPLVLIGKKSVKAFGDFDAAMTKSTSIMRNLAPAMRSEMEAVARQLSTESVTAAKDLAAGYEFLALAGLSARTSIEALPKVNAFAIAGAFDMATATDLLTDAQDALRMSSKDTNVHIANMAHLADSVAFAATQANDSIQGFATMLTRDAGVAMKNLNMELKTGLAVLSAYASQGIKGAQAGNMFGRATRLLTKAARENADVWASIGVDVIDKTTGEYRNFIDILSDMEKVMEKLTAPDRAALLDQLGFAALAQKSILPLIGMTDAMREYETQLASVAGTTQAIADAQQKSFNAELQITKNMLTDAGITIGTILAPALLKLNGMLRTVAAWWKGLSKETQKAIVWISAVAASIGPILLGLAGVSAALSVIIGMLATVGGAVTLAIATFTAFAALGTWLYESFEWIQLSANNFLYVMLMVWEGIRYAFELAVVAMRIAWDGFMNWLTGSERTAGKEMFSKIKKESEDRMKLWGKTRDIAADEIKASFEAKRAAKDEMQVEEKKEENIVAAAAAESEKISLDELGLAGGDGLSQFGTAEAIGSLSTTGLELGGESIMENLSKQALTESKKQTTSLEKIEKNSEWA